MEAYKEISYPTLGSNMRATWYIFKNRLTTYSRYRGQIIMSVLTPILIATIPIIMGSAIAGNQHDAALIFNKNTGLKQGSYAGYMLIGALLFQLVTNSLWNFGFWLRREQLTGTLESGVYLVPTNRAYLIIGSSLYVLVRNSISFIFALVLGTILFSISLEIYLPETIFLGIFVLAVGLPPLIGMALVFGAIILRFKEVGAMIQFMQWVFSFLMGIFYPITLLPGIFRVVAQLIPVTWTTNEIRAVLYETPYFIDLWTDITISIGFMFIVPVMAFIWFSRVEKNILSGSGVGKY